jgi:hypothetical protein
MQDKPKYMYGMEYGIQIQNFEIVRLENGVYYLDVDVKVYIERLERLTGLLKMRRETWDSRKEFRQRHLFTSVFRVIILSSFSVQAVRQKGVEI